MSRLARIRAEAAGAMRTFLRRRTAVFFTFFFPVVLIVIFAGLVRTQGGGGAGLFSEPTGYYLPAYLATVVLFTPLSRVGSEVARHREDNRFEKLSTTPLTRAEWLAAHALVNVALIVAASLLLVVALLLTGASFEFSPWLAFFVPVSSVLFCGVGAILGSLAEGQDGAIAASNGIALPLLFLSETFVQPALFPEWFRPLLDVSPLVYFSRGVRAATFPEAIEAAGSSGVVATNAAVTLGLAVVAFTVGAALIPWTE
ncbi:ABC transporter permease [Halobacterium jilantaiense]|uniref:ABC-2 type transport system permease protein n=1 Tax=Halobacterium jilantaiense TaxID=355548 RepID=A0A1I0NEW6_9EURY|nr:ABC transporter permease [Halobacterium jilantaiense]SEV99780.1 ABC-2 type transport system permease protein [Halobacterium jilantaiense]